MQRKEYQREYYKNNGQQFNFWFSYEREGDILTWLNTREPGTRRQEVIKALRWYMDEVEE